MFVNVPVHNKVVVKSSIKTSNFEIKEIIVTFKHLSKKEKEMAVKLGFFPAVKIKKQKQN
jgi:hypothetical protein